ncbi:MAG: TIGR02099 family protein [Proteobacteria bacterium]|nr:TIGR02099 family protein [Pseudomonadota bacterium]
MSLNSPVKAAAPLQRAAPTVRWAALRWGGRVLLGLIVAAWSLLLIAWLILQWGILPHIQQWRGPIEERASAALGVPVRIGSIDVRSRGWAPSVELRDVVLLDRDQREAVRLPRIVAAVSPRSLLSMTLRFEQLLIDGPNLEVRRDAQGVIRVAGLDFRGGTGTGANDHAAADWFFDQREFVIRGGTLRWVDERRQVEPLVLSDVQFIVHNSLRAHAIRIDATPPPEWGDRLTLTGRFTHPLLGRRGDWRHWSGSLYASLPRADVRLLGRHLSLPVEVGEGDGALRGWLDVHDGEPQAATVDLALRAVSVKLDAGLEPLALEQVQGRLRAERHGDSTTLGLQHFSFVTGDGLRWPQGDASLTWQRRGDAPATAGEFSAQRLDIGVMAQLASRVPLGDALRKLLAELDPKGQGRGIKLRWDGPIDAPRHYRAQAELSGVSLAAHASIEAGGIGRPGLHNASLVLDANEAGGTAQIGMSDGAIELPGVYDEPLVPLQRLAATLQWTIEPAGGDAPPKITVRVKDSSFANADAQGTLSAAWTTGPGTGFGREGRYPGRLELDSTLKDGQAKRVGRYLPNGLPRAVREYVTNAIRGGTLRSGSFHIDGPLWDFPYANPHTRKAGVFRFAADLDDVEFAYVPDQTAESGPAAYVSPWPAMQHLRGQLVIDRTTLEVRQAEMLLGGVQWKDLKAGIRDLDNAVLTVAGSGSGQLADMLGFVAKSPVGGWLDGALAEAEASGTAELKLDLAIPIPDTGATRVQGSVTLAGNTLRLVPEAPQMTAAKGRVDFTEHGVTVVGASARVFGGDAHFDGGTQADGTLRFSGAGTATADGLKRAVANPEVMRAAELLSGQAAYKLSLGFVHGKPEVALTSDLVGMAISLPAPLWKNAEATLPLRYESALVPESLAAGQSPRDRLRFELGSLVQAIYQRDLSGPAPRVLRGGIGVMDTTPNPADGVAANVNVATLDLDPWRKLYDRLSGNDDSHAATSSYIPETIALRVQRLDAGARHLDKLVAGISQSDGLWRATLDAEQLDGYVEYRPPRGNVGAGRVVAKLSRLSLPKTDGENVESLLDEAPTSIPALDIVVDELNLHGHALGRLQLEALNRGDIKEAAREWRLTRFVLTTPDAEFNATGTWGAATAGARRTAMDFTLDIADSGALLARFGTPGAIRGGKGKLTGQISWQGSPWSIDYPSLAGQMKVAIDSGQFLKVDPGAGRLLSVLSLQSLTRRLTFDFRDLFQQGFAFDNISGDVTIAHGAAETNNLRMRGAQAVVLMDGRADIDRETQDLRVWVVPDVNAGAASLAYAVINPAIGLGTFLAQVVLKKQLAAAGTREFHVHGSWADPKVDTVDRKLGDDVPHVDAAPPAAAAASSPVIR